MRVITDQDGNVTVDDSMIKELLKRNPEMISERDIFGKAPFHYYFETQRSHLNHSINNGNNRVISPVVWSLFAILEQTGADRVIDKMVRII